MSQVSQEDVERLAESLRILGGQALEWHESIAEMQEVIAALAARVAAIETRLHQQDDFHQQIHAWWVHDQRSREGDVQWQRERQ